MASLRALECLVAVADSGSVTQAARLLHSSQPAVSHQLAALEREAGTMLLRREPRGVKLTPAGRAAVADARRAIEAAASAVQSARAVGEATGGSLRLACAQSLVSVLAPVVREWHHHHPKVAITLRESTSAEELYGFTDADEADVVLMPAPVPDRFTATVVADEEIVLAAPMDHPIARQPVVRVQDLDGVRLVHFAPDNGLSTWLDRSLTKAGVRPVAVMRTSVTVAAPQLAAAGLGVAVCPVSAISVGFPGAVRSFSPRWVRQLVAVTPTTLDPLAARFIANLRRHGVHVPRDVRTQLAGDN
ncbi:LysR family transcriptional regulator [Microbispora bryophytorum]|uniref:LysR family transcriptional regulator n=1 Tax=Microbispora bryophytorum subsp. camponoti TaxID=1677852 RepID=A0ABR8LFF7_9ACTN|nr:LysR family transcriptional regulator [Microbispora camponoti]MBD3148579.1 LysR family transcriptional regulator [Microbispora camponoti]